MNVDGKLVGETVVRGVDLKLRELGDGGYRLSWSGVSVDGATDLHGPEAAGEAWAKAISELRESPERDPLLTPVDAPELAM
ncbi:hypothetical protein [Paracoccus sp. ME4]|uniref:hypothetical protein n=1 Tax=Paracoccus sp. ME4 TaxID=3138066 RepID=UPI00398ADE5D